MLGVLTVLTAIVALLLMLAVLIQNPKGGGIDTTYGSGAQQMFGAARSTETIEKITWYLVAALMILCIISFYTITKGTTEIKLQSQQ